jgi:hypothetical protein
MLRAQFPILYHFIDSRILCVSMCLDFVKLLLLENNTADFLSPYLFGCLSTQSKSRSVVAKFFNDTPLLDVSQILYFAVLLNDALSDSFELLHVVAA